MLYESQHNTKLMWKTIKDFARNKKKKRSKIQVSSLIIGNGKELITDLQQIGNTYIKDTLF